MLQRIYNILFAFREYFILSGLVILSLILLALNDNTQVKRIRSIATVIFGVFENELSFIPAYLNLARENETLRRVNIELADQANQLREGRLENIRLRQLVGLKDHPKYTMVAGRVIGKNLTLLRNTLTLDVGRADGVQEHMPVVSDGGLVGIVVGATDHYSVVNIVLNVDFRASAKVQRSRVDGILAWDGKTLFLKNVSKTLDVRVGDVITTSDYSSSYPADIRIGLVSDVTEQAGSLFKAVGISPGVDFTKLEEVFVLAFIPDTERLDLEQRMLQRSMR